MRCCCWCSCCCWAERTARTSCVPPCLFPSPIVAPSLKQSLVGRHRVPPASSLSCSSSSGSRAGGRGGQRRSGLRTGESGHLDSDREGRQSQHGYYEGAGEQAADIVLETGGVGTEGGACGRGPYLGCLTSSTLGQGRDAGERLTLGLEAAEAAAAERRRRLGGRAAARARAGGQGGRAAGRRARWAARLFEFPRRSFANRP